ncbi:unnamed protein product [Nippostrongylus brasiliensis]|uniref:Protein AAR2 homolog n=1 Tax=Nippostrongylus brasiliensis TaxID=27835 RepID=A0A0N4YS90_NIPBR|nr:unnamed protein product [Nippostrongylus brasiliensis]
MAFHILHTLKHGAELPPEVVNYMYSTGAFVILKDFPEGHEFGIDYKSWTVGPKFLGLKMIPAGVHFVYCSVKGAPRIGFFHNFKSEEIVAKRWDAKKETFSDEVVSDEEINRIRMNLKNIDSMLGPYPFENYRSWYALTDFINGQTVERVNPLKGQISAQAELVSMETCLMENEEADENRVGIDYTDRLERVLRQLDGDWKQLLAEVQFAFACFLIGQVFEGFEQWKRVIHLLCCCPSALGSRSDMFIAFIRVLFFELKECPTDFFVDIVSRDNFLTTTLSMLFANIRGSISCIGSLFAKIADFF